MPVVTNVFRREGTFYFRVAVPKDLRSKIGRKELWRSLRTSDPPEARRRGGMLLSLTQSLWQDLRAAMTPRELQGLVQAWLRAKLDDDEAARMLLPRKELEDLHRRHVDVYAGAWENLSNDDPTEAKAFLDEFIGTLNLRLSDSDYEAAARMIMRSQSQLFRALCARHAYSWQPGDPRPDPAAYLRDALGPGSAMPHPPDTPATSVGKYGLLSEVAREAIPDIGRLEGWKPKRFEDYENAVATFIDATGRDPDLGEITPEIAGSYMRDLTAYPSNPTKRLDDFLACWCADQAPEHVERFQIVASQLFGLDAAEDLLSCAGAEDGPRWLSLVGEPMTAAEVVLELEGVPMGSYRDNRRLEDIARRSKS